MNAEISILEIGTIISIEGKKYQLGNTHWDKTANSFSGQKLVGNGISNSVRNLYPILGGKVQKNIQFFIPIDTTVSVDF